MSSEANVLPTLSRKIDSLDQLNRAIFMTKEQLEKLCQQRDQLEAEIFAIRSINAPVKRLPVELLSRVFEECIIPNVDWKRAYEEASRDIVKILLVCKSWRSIAINTCSLWSHISVSVPRGVNLKAQVNSIKMQHHYLDLYLSRSRQTPLTAMIDFQNMRDGLQIARDAVHREFGDLIDIDEQIGDWLADMPWASLPICNSYLSLCDSLIQKFIGIDGQHIARCSSLTIWLPENHELASHLRGFFLHNAPQLKTLSIFGEDPYSEEQHRFLHSLVALSELILARSDCLSTFQYCSTLKKLHLCLELDDYATTPFHLINSFQVLDELCFESGTYQVDDPFPSPILQLPSVKILELRGPLSHSFVQALRVEKLNKLVIWQVWANEDTIPIADVCRVATSVEWDYDVDDDPLFDVLSKLFSQLLQVAVIEVPHYVEETAEEVITHCRTRGLLQSLKSVISFRQIYRNGGFIKVEQKPLMTL